MRQLGVVMHARDPLQYAAHRAVSGRPIRQRGGVFRNLAVAVGFGELAVGERHHALFRLDRAVAQHQVREIEVETVWRHVGAFRQEAHVA